MEADSPSAPGGFLQGFRSDAMWVILSLLVAGGLVLTFGLLAEEVVEGDTLHHDAGKLPFNDRF